LVNGNLANSPKTAGETNHVFASLSLRISLLAMHYR